MRLLSKLLLAAAFGFALSGCGIQRNCPEFDRDLLSWIPYVAGDSLQMRRVNDDGEFVLAVNGLEVHHTSQYMSDADCGGCDDYISLNDYTVGNRGLRVEIILQGGELVSETYIINGVEFDTDYSNFSEQTDFTFNNQCYARVKLFESKNPSDAYQKLIVAKDYGIVGLVDSNGMEWIAELVGVDDRQLSKAAFINAECGR